MGISESDFYTLVEEVKSLKEKLKKVEELDHKLATLQDRTLIEQVEQLALEDEVKLVEDMLTKVSAEELKEKLRLIDKVHEEFTHGKVHEKLNYLRDQTDQLKNEFVTKEQFSQKLTSLYNQIEELFQKSVPTPVGGADRGKGTGALNAQASELYGKLQSLTNYLKELKIKFSEQLEREESRIAQIDNYLKSLSVMDLSEIKKDIEGLKAELEQIKSAGPGTEIDKASVRKIAEMEQRISKGISGGKLEDLDSGGLEQIKSEITKINGEIKDLFNELKVLKSSQISQKEAENILKSLPDHSIIERLEENLKKSEEFSNKLLKVEKEVFSLKDVEVKFEKIINNVVKEIDDKISAVQSDFEDKFSHIETLMEKHDMIKKEISNMKSSIEGFPTEGDSAIKARLAEIETMLEELAHKEEELEERIINAEKMPADVKVIENLPKDKKDKLISALRKKFKEIKEREDELESKLKKVAKELEDLNVGPKKRGSFLNILKVGKEKTLNVENIPESRKEEYEALFSQFLKEEDAKLKEKLNQYVEKIMINQNQFNKEMMDLFKKHAAALKEDVKPHPQTIKEDQENFEEDLLRRITEFKNEAEEKMRALREEYKALSKGINIENLKKFENKINSQIEDQNRLIEAMRDSQDVFKKKIYDLLHKHKRSVSEKVEGGEVKKEINNVIELVKSRVDKLEKRQTEFEDSLKIEERRIIEKELAELKKKINKLAELALQNERGIAEFRTELERKLAEEKEMLKSEVEKLKQYSPTIVS